MSKTSVKRTPVLVRLREEDHEIIQQIAKQYDISEADAIKIVINEYKKNHKIEVTS